MSDRQDEKPARRESEPAVEEVEVPALTALLKRSLATPEDEEAARGAGDDTRDQQLVLGVQRKLRQRSRGKFYADGWSTTHSRVNYALVAAIMLVVVLAVYFALGPTGISFR